MELNYCLSIIMHNIYYECCVKYHFIFNAVLFNLFLNLVLVSLTESFNSSASFFDRMPTKSKREYLPVILVITSLKLSLGSLNDASLSYASLVIVILLVAI